jgi:signal transduction histidine kinase
MKTKIIILTSLAVIFFGGLCSCLKNENDASGDKTAEITVNKKIASAVVHSSAMGISETLKTLPDSASGVRFIRTYIDSIRFYDDKSGYFYVYNYQCTNIAHATQKDLEGQNLYNYLDSKGNYVIRLLSAAAKKGGGFVEYYWIKPGEQGEKQKIGYVEPINGSNYFIGTGVYIPD